MELREYLKNSGNISTPAYYFDTDVFEKRIDFVNRELPGIPLTFSIKANPFLLSRLPQIQYGFVSADVFSTSISGICIAIV